MAHINITRHIRAVIISVLAVGSFAGLGLNIGVSSAAPGEVYTFVGAGDIATSLAKAEQTAQVLDGVVAQDPNTTVWTTGDHAYPDGTPTEFSTLYDPTWGRHRARTQPVLGNHDYHTAGASGYFGYFCPSAANCVFPGGTQRPYYSYDRGNWHIVSLDSEVDFAAGSTQLQWLQQDLAANPGKCVAALFHKPYYNSGLSHGRSLAMKSFWDVLYAAKADVILNGHEHLYERFAKQNANSVAVSDGIRQFTVGTGGSTNNTFGTLLPNSQAQGTTQGVIKLSLSDTGYQWQFMPVAGTTYSDTGSDTCNNTSGNPAPSVTVTAPTQNAVVSGASVTLAANATDNTGVSGVQFKLDGVNVGAEDTTAPYEVTWDSTTAAEGQRQITAVARDIDDQTTTSAQVTVTVDNIPDTTATVESRILTSSDDAEQKANVAPVLNSSDLELVTDGSAQTVGLRFTNINVPRGATITKAYVQFSVDEAGSTATSLSLRGEAIDNAATFTTAVNNVSGRPLTAAAVGWTPPAWTVLGEAGAGQRTPDLTSIVSEITSRSGWVSNNALAILITGSGRRNANARDGSLGPAPLLHVEYSLAPADTTAPSAPSGLTATPQSSSQINLAWTAATDNVGVTGYRIFRNDLQIATSATTSYNDSGLTANTTYSYAVEAYDAAGNTSPRTAAVNATTLVASGPQTLTFRATADATILSGSANSNFGGTNTLEGDSNPVSDFLLKFDLTGLAGKTITSAKLSLYNVNASVKGGAFYRTISTSWTETGVTWNNAPAPDATAFATLGAVSTNQWYDVNVMSLLTGDGTYSFRVKGPSSDGVHYRSKEVGITTAPVLTVVVQ